MDGVDELAGGCDTISLSWERGVLRVTLDAPDTRNALSSVMLAELSEVVARVPGLGRSVRAMLLTGADPSFCAGLDLRERVGGTVASGRPLIDLVHALRALPVPVVARVNGATRAGGLILVAACDIAVADDSATFSMTETRLGLTPEMTLATIAAQTAPVLLRRFALTGEVFDARAAERLRLVSEVAAPGALDHAVDGVLDGLRQCSPTALASTKQRLEESNGLPALDALLLAADASTASFASAEAREGIAAMQGRRTPSWAY